MKKIPSFLKEHQNVYILYILFLVVVFFAALTEENLSISVTILVPSLLILLVFSLIQWLQFQKKNEQLEQLAEKNDYTQMSQLLLKPSNQAEIIYREMLLKVLKEKETQQQKNSINQEEIWEDFSLWLDQIKLPVAGMELTLQSPEPNLVDMQQELFKINESLQLMTNYLRQNLEQEELLMEAVSLDAVVNEVLKKYGIFFSQKNLRLVLKSLNVKVYTDRRWLKIMLEQLLFNAIKYTKNGEIAIFWSDNQLIIADTGVGIHPDDLPKIFEKGFTRDNNRKQHISSGLGLYLCQMAAGKIGIQMRVGSILGKGTRVYLTFPEIETIEDVAKPNE